MSETHELELLSDEIAQDEMDAAERDTERERDMPTKNLRQRILDVTREVGSVSATSKNQFGKAALGIGDVEDALRGVLATAGITTEWGYVALTSHDGPGNMTLWMAHLCVDVVNADDATDRLHAEWMDIGGNPMAATSFARKGYLKSLFHITEADDEGPLPAVPNGHRTAAKPVAVQRRPAPPAAPVTAPHAPTRNGESVPAWAVGELGHCPRCGGWFKAKVSGKTGTTYYQCSGKLGDGSWCNSFASRDAVGQYEAGLRHEEPFVEDVGIAPGVGMPEVDPADLPF